MCRIFDATDLLTNKRRKTELTSASSSLEIKPRSSTAERSEGSSAWDGWFNNPSNKRLICNEEKAFFPLTNKNIKHQTILCFVYWFFGAYCELRQRGGGKISPNELEKTWELGLLPAVSPIGWIASCLWTPYEQPSTEAPKAQAVYPYVSQLLKLMHATMLLESADLRLLKSTKYPTP